MTPPPDSRSLIGLEPQTAAATAGAWEAQGSDLTGSARALAGIADDVAGFTDHVRSDAAEFAQRWARSTAALAERCHGQAGALRATAAGLAAADDASGAALSRIAAMWGAA